MAADKSLIQGAAALAQADSAMGSAFTKGAAAGAAPVMKQFMQNIEKENKLNDQLVANAEAINMKIMTDPKAGGEYHEDIRAIATTTRSEILNIAKDKSLSRTERNRLITEKVDGFNSTTSKYLIGQKIEQDFNANIASGGFSNENTALKEDAATISEYFKGVGEVNRTETGFVFKNWNDSKENKEISFEELKNYLPKKVDGKALNKMEVDVERLAKKKYGTEAEFDEAINIEMNGYNIDERKNLLSNKLQYGDISGLSEDDVNKNFKTLFTQNVKDMVQPEQQDNLSYAEGKNNAKKQFITDLFKQIDNIKVGEGRNAREITGLPSNYQILFQENPNTGDRTRFIRNIGANKADIQLPENAKAADIIKLLKGSYQSDMYTIGMPIDLP